MTIKPTEAPEAKVKAMQKANAAIAEMETEL